MKPNKPTGENEARVPDSLISLSGTVHECTIDTLKVGFPLRCVNIPRGYVKTAFERMTRESAKDGTRETYRLSSVKDILGLAELSFRPRTETDMGNVTLRLSAKTLGRDYFDGIHAGNIEAAIRAALPREVKADTYEIVQAATVFEVHVCTNYPADAHLVMANVTRAPFNQKAFTKTEYGKGSLTGLEWRSHLKTSSVKLHLYDKPLELARRPAEAELLNAERFTGYTRVEAQIRKYSDLREAYGIEAKGPIRLEDVLSKTVSRRALYAVMDKVIFKELEERMEQDAIASKSEIEARKVAEAAKRTRQDYAIYAGYVWWYDFCRGDWRTMEAQIRSAYPRGHNLSRHLKRVRTYWDVIERQGWNEEAANSQDEITRLRAFVRTGKVGFRQDESGQTFATDGTLYRP